MFEKGELYNIIRRFIFIFKQKTAYEIAVAAARRKATEKNLKAAFSKLDRAVGAKVITKNKAARLKSRLASRVK